MRAADIPMATPLRVIEIRQELPLAVQTNLKFVDYFIAHPTGLYFLGSMNPTADDARSVILRTDQDGVLKKTIHIGPRQNHGRFFGVDSKGRVYVLLHSEPTGLRLVVFDQSGTEFQRIPVLGVSGVADMTLVNDVPVLVTSEGLVASLSGSSWTPVMRVGPARVFHIRPVTGTRFAVVKAIEAEITIGDLEGGVVRTALLDAPEVQAARAGCAECGHPGAVLLDSLANSPIGSLYISILCHPLAEGAVVLKLDGQGNVQESLRFAIPTYAEYKTAANPAGYMPGGYIGATEGEFFIVSPRASLAVYSGR
ncbi:MAG TPA: hypothetical protein VFA33_02360 [Bryobacteraceae bacterium]|nr:hypothetical protein [Bryobacteraceae bacterium]